MIKREISQKILDLSEKFPVITVTGPRQSGKTTLLRNLFGDMFYSSLENPETRMFAIQDPKGFLQQYANGGIIDEAQLVPELFSFIQSIVDESASGSTRVRIPISILGEIITGWRSILS